MLNREEYEDEAESAASEFLYFSDRLGEIAAHLGQTEYADYAANPSAFSEDADDLESIARELGQWPDWMEALAHE